ncbi:hypothetical protein [Ilyobacter sp.]|uniref:hypothetical protein n=1 Tax=Ilyobacter sp. TaxID=3100343 RepID=UPI00356B307F
MYELDEILKKLKESKKKLPNNPKDYNNCCKELKKYENELFSSYGNTNTQIGNENMSEEMIACQKELQNWAKSEFQRVHAELSKSEIDDDIIHGFMKRLEEF